MLLKNNFFFLYKFFFMLNYLLVAEFFFSKQKKQKKKKKLFLENRNTYVCYKVFVVNNFSKMYFHKNNVFASANSYKNSVITITTLFKLRDYQKFFSFFFFCFFNKLNLLLFSFKLFFFDFLSFMTYLYDSSFFIYFSPLLQFYQEKKSRKRFFKLLRLIFKKYKPKLLLLYDYKYSAFFFKLLFNTNLPVVGFKYFNTSKVKYHYYLFVGKNNLLIKYAVFQQIFNIYVIAVNLRNIELCKKFFITYKYFYLLK